MTVDMKELEQRVASLEEDFDKLDFKVVVTLEDRVALLEGDGLWPQTIVTMLKELEERVAANHIEIGELIVRVAHIEKRVQEDYDVMQYPAQENIKELSERVATLEEVLRVLDTTELLRRISSLEKYRVDYMNVCERLARLERENVYLRAVVAGHIAGDEHPHEPLPRGDLD